MAGNSQLDSAHSPSATDSHDHIWHYQTVRNQFEEITESENPTFTGNETWVFLFPLFLHMIKRSVLQVTASRVGVGKHVIL